MSNPSAPNLTRLRLPVSPDFCTWDTLLTSTNNYYIFHLLSSCRDGKSTLHYIRFVTKGNMTTVLQCRRWTNPFLEPQDESNVKQARSIKDTTKRNKRTNKQTKFHSIVQITPSTQSIFPFHSIFIPIPGNLIPPAGSTVKDLPDFTACWYINQYKSRHLPSPCADHASKTSPGRVQHVCVNAASQSRQTGKQKRRLPKRRNHGDGRKPCMRVRCYRKSNEPPGFCP